ncbi:DUF6058 family natural product biosynthesis protein [Colwelliaceae bacterium 6471]
MELTHYLNKNFLSKKQLLDTTKVTKKEFRQYQKQGVMPKHSYRINLTLECDSFFGPHLESQAIEYYAKGYTSWLAIIQSLKTTEAIYEVFYQRYANEIERLKTLGHHVDSEKLNVDFDLHVQEEWLQFINGIYGLCTKTGLPEDIAAKEFAIIEIHELTVAEDLTPTALARLSTAVNLLDEASNPFAPHEYHQSTRYRLVDEVRRKYSLRKA